MAIGLSLGRPSGEALIGAQQEISENSGFGVSAVTNGEHGNTSATLDRDILKVWRDLEHVRKRNKEWRNRFLHRRCAEFHLAWTRSSTPAASSAKVWIQDGCHGEQVIHQNSCENYSRLITGPPTHDVQMNSTVYSLFPWSVSEPSLTHNYNLSHNRCPVPSSGRAVTHWLTFHRSRKRGALCRWRVE